MLTDQMHYASEDINKKRDLQFILIQRKYITGKQWSHRWLADHVHRLSKVIFHMSFPISFMQYIRY